MLLVLTFASSSTAETDLELAKRLGKALEQCRVEKRLEVEACREQIQVTRAGEVRVGLARVQAEHEIGNAKLAGCEKKLELTEDARLEAERDAARAWYEDPAMWFWAGATAGIAAGLVGAVGAVWGVSQLTDRPLRPAL
jgi:hypothetical protein